MGLGKTYSADYLIDSNGNTGVSGQVLISTATGIDWADGTAITGGPFLPLAGGTMTGNVRFNDTFKAEFGSSADFQINHDGTDSLVNNGTGNLTFRNSADNKNIIFQADNGSGGNAAYLTLDGSNTNAYFSNPGTVLINATAARDSTSKLSVQGGMSEFETTLTNNEDWANSPISIGERANIGSVSADNKYSPNLNFHWSGRVSNSLWMSANGHLNWGSYTSAGVPAADGTFNAGPANFAGGVTINHSSGETLLLTKSTTEPSVRFEGDTDKDFVLTVSGETFTITQNDGATDILILDHDTKNATFAGDVTINGAEYVNQIQARTSAGLKLGNDNNSGFVFIKDSKEVCIGTEAPSYNNNYGTGDLNVENNTFASAQIFSHSSTVGNYSFLGLGKSSGTGASPTIVVAQERVGAIGYYGYDGADYRRLASIDGAVDGTPGAGDMPGRLMFSTTADGAATPTEIMRIDSAGNVGIGTTDPTAKLDIKGDGADFFLQSADYKIARIQPRGTGADLDKGLFSLFNGNTESVRIDTAGNSWLNGGNVGIGTTAPDSLSANTSSLSISSARADLTGAIFLKANGVTKGQIYWDSTGQVNDTLSGAIKWRTGSAERMRIDSSGNVGIGADNPGSLLHIKGETKAYITFEDTTDGVIGFVGDAAQMLTSGTVDNLGLRGEGGVQFGVSDVIKMVLNSSGNVGIGTTAPGTKLDVDGAITAGTANSTSGSVLMYGKYSNGHIATIGTEYSNGGLVLGYGVTPSTTAAGGFVSSSAATNLTRGAYSFAAGTHKWWSDPVSTTIAVGTTSPLNNTMTLLDTGNLGIGTTAPGAKLQIGSATYAPNANLGNNLLQIKSPSGFAYLTIGNGDSANSTSYIGGASGFTVIGSVTDAGALSEHMRITNTGNVGIGTASPLANLHSSASGNLAIPGLDAVLGTATSLAIGNDGGSVVLAAGVSNSNVAWLQGRQGTGTGNAFNISLNPLGGNVGIGTAGPEAKLHVSASSGVVFKVNANNAAKEWTIDTTNPDHLKKEGTLNLSADPTGVHTNTRINFFIDGSNKMRIQDNGNVGINTTDPLQKLHVVGNARVTGAYYDSNNSPGTAGQVLSSTVTGTDWVAAGGGSGSTVYSPDIWEIVDSQTISNGTTIYRSQFNGKLVEGTTNTTGGGDDYTIKVVDAGVYEISYSATLKTTYSVRQVIAGYFELDDAVIAGSAMSNYLRLTGDNQGGVSSVSNSFYCTISANQILKFAFQQIGPATGFTGMQNMTIIAPFSGMKSTVSVRRIT